MLVYPSITPLPQYKERDSVDPLLDDLLEVEDMYTTVLYNDEVSYCTLRPAHVGLAPQSTIWLPVQLKNLFGILLVLPKREIML